jgi:hypothetical protein
VLTRLDYAINFHWFQVRSHHITSAHVSSRQLTSDYTILRHDIIVITSSSWDGHTPLLEMVCSRWPEVAVCVCACTALVYWDAVLQLGPDPTRFRSGTFCVRWEGVITPDTTVKGGKFQIGLGKSRFTGKTPDGMGGRLWVGGAENALFWSHFTLNTEYLPRQAQDKHSTLGKVDLRGNGGRFLQGR